MARSEPREIIQFDLGTVNPQLAEAGFEAVHHGVRPGDIEITVRQVWQLGLDLFKRDAANVTLPGGRDIFGYR